VFNVLGIVTVYFYHMTTVPSRKRNKNTKQRRRKEQTLMESINKEKDFKTEIKGKSNNFIWTSLHLQGMLPMPSGTSQEKLDAFFDGISPGGLTCTLQLEVKCSWGAVAAEWHHSPHFKSL
jgi:hypothetical protein